MAEPAGLWITWSDDDGSHGALLWSLSLDGLTRACACGSGGLITRAGGTRVAFLSNFLGITGLSIRG